MMGNVGDLLEERSRVANLIEFRDSSAEWRNATREGCSDTNHFFWPIGVQLGVLN